MIIGSKQRLQTHNNNEIEIKIDNTVIKKVHHAKSLGFYIDDTLSWTKHIDIISKKIASGIGALKRLMPNINLDTAVTIYNSVIDPHFQYCSTVWDGLAESLSEKLKKTAKLCSGHNNEIQL